jgi:hypothetical protein
MCRGGISLAASQLWAVAYQCVTGQGETRHGPGGPTLLGSRPASQQPQSHMRAVEMSSLHNRAEKVMGEETVGVRLANQGSARKYCQKFYLIIRNFVADGLFAFSSHGCNEYVSITACAPMSW